MDEDQGSTFTPRIPVPLDRIAAFCRKWRLKELSLFGSVLTDEFRPDSDVDVLVVYDEQRRLTITEFLDAQEELTAMLGRQVDLVEKSTIRNPFRRHHILHHRQVIYAA